MTNLEDRRTHYLELAGELAYSDGSGPTAHLSVGHVSLAAVAEQAGVSRSALYRIWPSQHEFWTDLIEFILLPPDDDPAASSGVAPLTPAGAPEARGQRGDGPGSAATTDMAPLTYHLLDMAHDVLLSDPLPLLRTAVVCYPDTSASHHLVEEHRRRVLPQLERQLSTSLAATGRRCRDGVSIGDLAAAVTAVGNGLPVIGRITAAHDLRFDNPAFAKPLGTPRSLLGVSVEAIKAHLTCPGDASTRAPVAAPERTGEPGRAARWSRRETEYLSIAVDLALSPPDTGAGTRCLGHVDLSALARAAGVTRRTMSNLWASQEQFRADLFVHLLRADRERISRVVADTTAELRTAPDAEPFRLLGDHLHRSLESAVGTATFLAFAPQLEVPEFVSLAGREHAILTSDLSARLRSLLRTASRRTRPGVSFRQLSVALVTLLDGMHRLARTDPCLVDRTITVDGHTHTVTAWAVDAVLSELTEPVVRRPLAVRLASMLA